MPPHHDTPKDLVEALQRGHPSAREELRQRLGDGLRRLLDVLRLRRGLRHDPGLLFRNVLHSLAVALRTRPLAEFDGMGWDAFLAALLVQAGKLTLEPFGGSLLKPGPVVPHSPAPGPSPLPICPVYHSETYFLPFEQVGAHRFGGDWYAGRHGPDGSLWVIVADVTGHGYYAYLLAATLPHLWSLCWEAGEPKEPAELLQRLHHRLEESLPEGVYVEATLARLRPDGQVVVAPGGGIRLLLRQRTQMRVALMRLRGGWLGFMAPSAHDQHSWALAEGDELLLGTDGLFDQVEAILARDLGEHLSGAPGLFRAMERLLRDALERHPQKDDITLVLLRKRGGP